MVVNGLNTRMNVVTAASRADTPTPINTMRKGEAP
ncbi:hypothetical protein PSYPI_24959 [Pseudomonas syringae pv. pisi str. 1704B]|uniref:Uncharacterized protein n=1 Tax=Pseudomonas syringae pv. pisi str. 1704B TaxID=629263 RepID=F3GE93_PSESJ|nr:hypothetical protein PSYPI_24959 [Pseudomonas syringae pv. pisi str. 1704B]